MAGRSGAGSRRTSLAPRWAKRALGPGPCRLVGQRCPVRNIKSDQASIQAIALVARGAAAPIGDADRSSSFLSHPKCATSRPSVSAGYATRPVMVIWAPAWIASMREALRRRTLCSHMKRHIGQDAKEGRMTVSDAAGQAKGLTNRSWPSTRRPACMSSVHKVSHPAIRAAATIIAS